jgi:hypothetical protein
MSPKQYSDYQEFLQDCKFLRANGFLAYLNKFNPLLKAFIAGAAADEALGKGFEALKSGDDAGAANYFQQGGAHYLHVMTNAIATGNLIASGVGVARIVKMPGTFRNPIGGLEKGPRKYFMGEGDIKKNVIKQAGHHDCVPTVGKMVADDLGIKLPVEQIGRELGTTLDGASIIRLGKFFKIRGFEVEMFGGISFKKLSIEGLIGRLNKGKIAIVSINEYPGAVRRKPGHAVIVDSFDANTKTFWIRDPGEGRTRSMDLATFKDQWIKSSNKSVIINPKRK